MTWRLMWIPSSMTNVEGSEFAGQRIEESLIALVTLQDV